MASGSQDADMADATGSRAVPVPVSGEEEEQEGYFFDLTNMGIGFVYAGKEEQDKTVFGTWGGNTGRYLMYDSILVNDEDEPVNPTGEELLGLGPPPGVSEEVEENLSQLFRPPGGGDAAGNLKHLQDFLDQEAPDFAEGERGEEQEYEQTNTDDWEQGKAESDQKQRQAKRLYHIAMTLTSAAVRKYQGLFSKWDPQELREIVILYFFCRMCSFLLDGGATQGFSRLLGQMAQRVYRLMG